MLTTLGTTLSTTSAMLAPLPSPVARANAAEGRGSKRPLTCRSLPALRDVGCAPAALARWQAVEQAESKEYCRECGCEERLAHGMFSFESL